MGSPTSRWRSTPLDRRLALLEAEGIVFECNCDVGRSLGPTDFRRRFDAVVLCVGAERGRDDELPGRHLRGVHMAMDYLVQQNRRVAVRIRQKPLVVGPPCR